ncbi:DUF397 domain-containing protein [Micromonospora sp. DT227]|uniref:DUF397 domain-containing protein n=1 Tax=Micromonospora sp. DT227 TaxID=3393433 RepID=UPI003CF72A00
MDEVIGARWRTSTRSGSHGGACVEVADSLASVVGVRDSEDPGGPVRVLAPPAWRAFVAHPAPRR